MHVDWWTLALQTINLLVLLWLLQRFFWKPVSAMIDARQRSTEALMTSARLRADEAAAVLAAAEAEKAAQAQAREAMLAASRDDAQRLADRMIEEARAHAAELEAAAEAARAKREEESFLVLEQRAASLAADIAGRLLVRVDPTRAVDGFLAAFESAVRTLPEATRQLLARAEGELRILSAQPLAEGDRGRIVTILSEVLAVPPALRFDLDEDLIAGLEMHSPHVVLRNSWRSDLDALRAEFMTHGRP